MQIDSILTRFESYLKSHSLKFTEQRKGILFAAADFFPSHFDVPQLSAALSGTGNGRRTGRATVYRTLELLVQAGILRRLTLDPAGAHYEFESFGAHHEHLICERCGKIWEFASPELERIQDEFCARLGFRVESHLLRITGICAQCQRETGESPAIKIPRR